MSTILQFRPDYRAMQKAADLAAYGESMATVDVCRELKRRLRARGCRWVSVTRGRGTACGWIDISAGPRRGMTDEERAELAGLLGLERVHYQGESIPAGYDYYREYLARAAGEVPTGTGKPYWD